MNSTNFVMFFGIVAFIYLVAIPIVYNTAKFGLEEKFMDLYSNNLSIGEASKLLIKYNKRCLNGMFIVYVILTFFGVISLSNLN